MLLSLCEIQLPLWSCSMLLPLKSTGCLSTEGQTQSILCVLAGEMVSEFLERGAQLPHNVGEKASRRQKGDKRIQVGCVSI